MTALYCPQCQKVHEFRRPHAVRRGLEVSWRDVLETLAGVIVLLLWCVAAWLWLAILAVQ